LSGGHPIAVSVGRVVDGPLRRTHLSLRAPVVPFRAALSFGRHHSDRTLRELGQRAHGVGPKQGQETLEQGEAFSQPANALVGQQGPQERVGHPVVDKGQDQEVDLGPTAAGHGKGFPLGAMY
jgi:hypothetical protein